MDKPFASYDSCCGLIPPGRSVLTVIEVAGILRVTPTHVMDLIEEGRLRAVNVGTDLRRHFRVPVQSFIEFLKNNGL